MSLGKRIRAARKAAGLTQAALAELCGYDPPSRLANYEQDTREPSLADLRNIAANVAGGGYTYARIILDSEELSQAVSLTGQMILDAIQAARDTVGGTGKDNFDPTRADDAEMVAEALWAILAGQASPSSDSTNTKFKRSKESSVGDQTRTGKAGGAGSGESAKGTGRAGAAASGRRSKSA